MKTLKSIKRIKIILAAVTLLVLGSIMICVYMNNKTMAALACVNCGQTDAMDTLATGEADEKNHYWVCGHCSGSRTPEAHWGGTYNNNYKCQTCGTTYTPATDITEAMTCTSCGINDVTTYVSHTATTHTLKCSRDYTTVTGEHTGGTIFNGGKCVVCKQGYDYTKVKCSGCGTYNTTYESNTAEEHIYRCSTCQSRTTLAHSGGSETNGGTCQICNNQYEYKKMKCIACKGYNTTYTSSTAGKHSYKCSTCGITTTENHYGGTSENGGICAKCGYAYHYNHIVKRTAYKPAASGFHVETYTCTSQDGCNYSYDKDKSIACSWVDATCTAPKTCSICGATSGSALGHNYADATCTKPKTCSTCGATSGSALGHNYSAATCTKPKTCNTCGATSGSALGHNYADATCTKPKTCTRCDATSGSALGHKYGPYEEVNSSTHQSTCSVCGQTSSTGHNWVEATCTEPKTCSDCGATEGEALGHSYGEYVDAGGGTHRRTCSVCGGTDTSGHTWVDATCTEPKTCSVCQATDGNALGHVGGTHANGGKCTVCEYVYQTHGQSTTLAKYNTTETGHTPVYGCTLSGCTGTYTGTEAKHTVSTWTDNTNGTHSGSCTVCKYKLTDEHNYTDGKCTDCKAEEPVTECEHTYVTKNSETQHWEECSKCDAVKTGSLEAHKHTTYTDNENGTHSSTCTVCSYKLTEEHTYEDGECTKCNAEETEKECTHTYVTKNDKTNHWEECRLCNETKAGSKEAHKYTTYTDNENGTHSSTCTVCSYKLTEEHTYEDGLCSECDAEEPEEVCEHTYEKQADKENHWEECTKCKLIKSGSLKAHIYTNYKNNQNGTHTATCSECNYELTEAHTADCKDCNPTGTIPGEDGKDDPTDGKEEPKDNTVVDDEKLPETGVSSIVMIGIITLGAVLAINAFKARKYKDI